MPNGISLISFTLRIKEGVTESVTISATFISSVNDIDTTNNTSETHILVSGPGVSETRRLRLYADDGINTSINEETTIYHDDLIPPIEFNTTRDGYIQEARIIDSNTGELSIDTLPESPLTLPSEIKDAVVILFFSEKADEELQFSQGDIEFTRTAEDDTVLEENITVTNLSDEAYVVLLGFAGDTPPGFNDSFDISFDSGNCYRSYNPGTPPKGLLPGESCDLTIKSLVGGLQKDQLYLSASPYIGEGVYIDQSITSTLPIKTVIRESLEQATITASSNNFGYLAQEGALPVYLGDDYTVRFQPNEGRGVTGLIINGAPVEVADPNMTSYTFTDVQENQQIEVLFGNVAHAQANPISIDTLPLGVIQEGEQIQFVDPNRVAEVMDAGTIWSWNFGDGISSNTLMPFHTYTTAGTYTVTLRIDGPQWGQIVVTELTVVQATPPLDLTTTGQDVAVESSYETEIVIPVKHEFLTELQLWVNGSGLSGTLNVETASCQSGQTGELTCIRVITSNVNEQLNQAILLLQVPENINLDADPLFIYHRSSASEDWQELSWERYQTEALEETNLIAVRTPSFSDFLMTTQQVQQVAGFSDSIASSGANQTQLFAIIGLMMFGYVGTAFGYRLVRYNR